MTLAEATAARQLAEAVYAADKSEANRIAAQAASNTELDLVLADIDARGNTTQPAAEVPAKAPFVQFLSKETYSLRGYAGRKSDKVIAHTLKIGETKFDFTKIVWADGSVSIRAYQYNTTILLHEFHSAA